MPHCVPLLLSSGLSFTEIVHFLAIKGHPKTVTNFGFRTHKQLMKGCDNTTCYHILEW
jgi:hypothetical protein